MVFSGKKLFDGKERNFYGGKYSLDGKGCIFFAGETFSGRQGTAVFSGKKFLTGRDGTLPREMFYWQEGMVILPGNVSRFFLVQEGMVIYGEICFLDKKGW